MIAVLASHFELRKDGDSWSVVDARNGSVSIVQGRTLARLSEGEARDAATLLNLVAGIRNAAPRTSPNVRSGLQPFLQPVR